MNVIFLIGIGQALFCITLLFSKKFKSLSDRVLIVWLLFIALHLLMAYGDTEGWHVTYPHWLGLSFPFPLAEGPFFFLYVLSLTRQPTRIQWKDLLHFLPFVFAYLMFWKFFTSSGAEKLHFYQNVLWIDPPVSVRIVSLMVMMTGPAYAVYVLWQLRRHRRNIQDLFSYSDEIDLRWIQYLALGMLSIWMVVWAVRVVPHEHTTVGGRGGFIYIAVTLFVFAIGYFGFKQGRIFVFDIKLDDKTERETLTSTEKYQKSGLKRKDQTDLLDILRSHMAEVQPYLNPHLTLGELAAQMEMRPHHLSQLINEGIGQNFFEFVNQYRVKAFQEAILDPASDKLTLLAIGLDCGFNSKSSFNRTFKQLTGQTPSQYAKNLSPKK
ncbi:MAG: AraC family transcriptional regulator [Bacteroidota bacterium]